MRRRRPQLTVSLFPFLSVLLCTLGSLILLLLVLDQKARQQRAEEINRQHAVARQEAERLQALAEQQLATLQSQAQERVATVCRQRDELLEQQRALAGQHVAKEQALRKSEDELAALEQLLAAERRGAAELWDGLQEIQAASGPLVKRKDAVAGELKRLMEQVALLEATVKKLQRAAQQPRPTLYSLVPYRGRLGTARRAIYVECVGQQVFFRPDGGNLFLTDLLEPGRMQKEIEDRFRKLPASGGERPYVLLLIRPSGIPLYYGVLRALPDEGIDLGYEFIEEDWEFDFTEPKPGDVTGDAAAELRLPGSRGSATPSATTSGRNDPGVGRPGSGGGRFPPRGSDGGPLIGTPLTARAPAGSGAKSAMGGGTTGSRPPAASGGMGSGASAAASTGGREAEKSSSQGGGEKAPTEDGKPAEAKGVGEKGARDAASGSGKGRTGGPTPVGGRAQREVPIIVECRAEGVILHPEKTNISTKELKTPANPLLEAVRVAAERRQRSPGLARPQLRYLIRPDGLRTYYRASALLESLQLRTSAEMLREDASMADFIP